MSTIKTTVIQPLASGGILSIKQGDGITDVLQIDGSGRLGIRMPSGAGFTNPMTINHDSTGTGMPGLASYGGIHLHQSSGNNGFVGITSKATSTGTQGGFLIEGGGGFGTKLHLMTTNDYNVGMKHRVVVDHLGKVGIGTLTPAVSLDVVGAGKFSDFTTGNVAPNSVLQRGAASVVGRMISFFIIALTPTDVASGQYTYYTSTPLDPGVWEIHGSMRENGEAGYDEDAIYEYHTVTTVPANNFLAYRLTGVAGTVTAVGLQYRFQSSGSSQNAYTSTSPAWSDIGVTNTVSASTSSNSDPIIGDGIRNGLVGHPPGSAGSNATTIAYFTGYAKKIG